MWVATIPTKTPKHCNQDKCLAPPADVPDWCSDQLQSCPLPSASQLLCCHGAARPYLHNPLLQSLPPALPALVGGIHLGGGVAPLGSEALAFSEIFSPPFTGAFSEDFPSARASDSCCANNSITAADEPPSSSREVRGRSRVASLSGGGNSPSVSSGGA